VFLASFITYALFFMSVGLSLCPFYVILFCCFSLLMSLERQNTSQPNMADVAELLLKSGSSYIVSSHRVCCIVFYKIMYKVIAFGNNNIQG